MKKESAGSFFILKLIGVLFSIAAIVLSGLAIWLVIGKGDQEADEGWSTLLLSAVILALATASIAALIWWIVTHPNRFWNYEP